MPITFIRIGQTAASPVEVTLPFAFEGTYANVAEVCKWLRLNGQDALADELATLLDVPGET